MVFKAVFNISVISRQPVHLSVPFHFLFPLICAIFFSSHLATFPHNHHLNNGQWRERYESWCNDHYQSLETSRASLRSNQRPPVLKSGTLPTDPHGHGSAQKMNVHTIYGHFMAILLFDKTINFGQSKDVSWDKFYMIMITILVSWSGIQWCV